MSKHLVFVYGTLKSGMVRHGVLRESEKIGEDAIKGTMINLGSFPGVVLQGNDIIHGEVYYVNERTLETLDHIEGHPCFYKRVKVRSCVADDEEECRAVGDHFWCYTLPESYLQEGHYQHIPTGVWTGV